MLVQLAAPTGQTHGNILYRAAVTGQQMSGAMSQGNNYINPFNQSGNMNAPALEWDRNLILTNESISDNNRTTQLFIRKTVPSSQGQVVHRINQLAFIKRVSVGDKRFSFSLLDQINNNLNEYRGYKTLLLLLAQVHLERHEIIFLKQFIKTCSLK